MLDQRRADNVHILYKYFVVAGLTFITLSTHNLRLLCTSNLEVMLG